jgi:ribosomal protein L21
MKVEEGVCIVINKMAIAWNNELEFQNYLNITHSKEKVQCQTSSRKAFLMKGDVNDEVPNGPPSLGFLLMG